ncbi:hypothetical protein Sgleb_28150 [Streptomyces glebosus]|uniref:Uncharacterized protein n=1 Tax=Streptomyces glebosus TaxID=249580 RepID=A0A640SUT7_9ACTN|nr:hypothetical protein Sgleb_28150 [Streptomyces glebosus]GHG70058.1 hypothetical protein GCM10010513_41520 [Streptomyces glebosus]
MINQSDLGKARTPQALSDNKDPRDVAASGGVAINPWEVDDMAKTIARIFESLLRLLLPARGRHRSFGCLPTVRREDAPTLVFARVTGGREGLLRGEDAALIRPYALTPEERQKRRLEYGRRRVPRFATYGADAAPRWLNGLEAAGR